VGDAHRLLQILSNLVGNAVKFTSSGSVSIRVALDQDRGPELRLRFEVSDTGIGVPAGKQDVIFEPFTQSDSSMTRRYGGTGLGLSIARQLCHMMDGDIGVRSEVGAGSVFWFTAFVQRSGAPLPAQQPPRVERASLPESIAAAPSPAEDDAVATVTPAGRAFQSALKAIGRRAVSILVVEDNPANMRVTQALLESLGCRVVKAHNGLEAVTTYRDIPFDLVLMDCQMPEMDGYEAARAIRQVETFQCRRTPIIALTAHAMPGSREASLAAGMDDQLTKPLTLSALTDKLLAWLTPMAVAAEKPAAG
jgi:CheY-like chemotaxis protein